MKTCNFKIIGSNKAFKQIENKILTGEGRFLMTSGILKKLKIGDKEFIFDVKLIDFTDKGVLLSGFMSDENKKVGRVILKYID